MALGHKVSFAIHDFIRKYVPGRVVFFTKFIFFFRKILVTVNIDFFPQLPSLFQNCFCRSIVFNAGPVRGGSGGSIDPPRILENSIKELKIEL